MTVGELLRGLTDALVDGSLMIDSKVVIDVDAESCVSDRNVLGVSELRADEVDEGPNWAFIQAEKA